MRMSRGLGIVLFTLLIVLIVSCSVWITQPYISDTDASTYVIVPMLMIPVFALFMLKDDRIAPKADLNSFVFGLVLFLLFIVLGVNASGSMGVLFLTYRIDMLLLPIGILAVASFIFGLSNIGRFVWIAVYSLFASPIILSPIINLNLGFASANSLLIFYMAKIAFHGLSYIAPITLYLNGYGVSIGNTCIGIGALIGLVMFLLPVAYFMEGRPRDKFVWVLGGLALMLLLNFIRMLLITVAWFAYGPNNSILDIHSFVGQLIFYGVIIIMILLHRRFRLEYPQIGFGSGKYEYSLAAVLVAVVLSMVYFALSLNYLSLPTVSFGSLAQNPTFDQNSVVSLYNTYIAYNGTSFSQLGVGNHSIAITLYNVSGKNQTELIIFAAQNSSIENSVLNRSLVTGWKEYLNEGIFGYYYDIGPPYPTSVLYSKVPYRSGGSVYLIDMYVLNRQYGSSNAHNCQSPYENVYDIFLNLFQFNQYTFNSSIDSQHCQIIEVLK